MNSNKEIKEEWTDYYFALEAIRQSGITNMFGAAPYLADMCDIDEDLAKAVLVNWIHNYGELNKKFNWR